MDQRDLFPTAIHLPEGFVYHSDFISTKEEQQLAAAIERLQFGEVKMHGVVAKRRTAHFGLSYDFQSFQLGAAPPIPGFLQELQKRIGEWSGCASDDFGEVLVTEYGAGASIGWHRDAPQFGVIVGVSLLSSCTMRFRPWPVSKSDAKSHRRPARPIAQVLEPRSAYLLAGAARTRWQHHIPAANALRYSITFRTLRGLAS